MRDLDDHQNLLGIVDRRQDAVVALADPIFLCGGQLLSAWWTRVGCQAPDSGDYALPVFGGEGFELFRG